MSNEKYVRTDSTLLPEDQELQDILDREQPRAVPASKQGQHYFDDATIRDLLLTLSLPTTIFDDDLTIFEVVRMGHDLLGQLADAVASRNSEVVVKAKIDACFQYLSEEDAPEKSDLILVFGAKSLLRAERAAELFAQGLASTIMVSGASPIYANENVSEAQRYQECFLNNNIPQAAIIVEDNAITIPDNVRRSLNLLDELNIHPRSMILVNSPFAQRRGWAVMSKHVPEGVKLYRVNSATSLELSASEWFKDEKSLRIVLNEFVKLRASVVYNTA